MKIVGRRSGLSPDLIRVWEKRYRAVTPERTDTNRRLYSDMDIERLILLKEVLKFGHSIGQVASLSVISLQKLLENERANPVPKPVGEVQVDPDELLVRAMQAVGRQDDEVLEECLERAMLSFGGAGMLHRFVAPLVIQVGDAWHAGKISPAHEHVASIVVREFLLRSVRGYATPDKAPCLIVGSPAGQLHELGATMIAAAAAHRGWRVRYLGPSLPAPDIAATALRHGARAIALSIVYPGDDPDLPGEILDLRKYLRDADVALLFGGMSVGGYLEAINAAGGVVCDQLESFFDTLDGLRS